MKMKVTKIISTGRLASIKNDIESVTLKFSKVGKYFIYAAVTLVIGLSLVLIFILFSVSQLWTSEKSHI